MAASQSFTTFSPVAWPEFFVTPETSGQRHHKECAMSERVCEQVRLAVFEVLDYQHHAPIKAPVAV